MTDVTRNNATLTVTSSSGTTAPSAGTSQTWTVASLPAAFGAALGTGETLRLVDSTSGATTAQQAEIVLVTAMDGTGDTSITVTRGVEGSTPVAHSTGATFAAVVTKAVFDGYVSRAPAPSGGDDSAALQAALNTITNPGGKVILRPGVYHLDSTSLIANAPGLILEGYGAPAQSPLLGLGGTQLRVASGLWGFRYNMNDGGAAYAGPQLRNLAFYQGASGALGGVQITHAHNFSLQGVTAEGFDTGIGFDIEGAADCCQYGTLTDVRGSNCQVGLKLVACNGMRMFGGMFDGNNNSAVIPAGRTAIQMVSGDTLRIIGTVIQFYTTCVDLQQGVAHELHGIRIEGTTLGVRVRGACVHVKMLGGCFSNYIVGSGGTAIQIDSGAQSTQILVPAITSVRTQLRDNGTNTTSLIDNTFRIAGRVL